MPRRATPRPGTDVVETEAAAPPADDVDVTGIAVPRWTVLADVLLQRAALVARVAHNRLPSPLAGLKVDDDDVVQLVSELPGLHAGDAAAAAEIERATAPAAAAARAELHELLSGDDVFADLVRHAQLDVAEAEVLAVLAAVEVDPRRQRLVGFLNDDVSQPWPTPFTLGLLFGGGVDAHLAVAPGGNLTRAALVSGTGDRPWATNPVRLAPSVVWWLNGSRSLDDALPPGVDVVAGPDTSGTELLVTVAGPDRLRRLQAAVQALVGSTFLVTPLPEGASEWQAVIRQATLAGLGVIVEVAETLPADGRDRIDRADHLPWAISSRHDLALESLPRRPWRSVVTDPAMATEAEWAAVFGPGTSRLHPLSAEQLRLVATAAASSDHDVASAVRRLAAGTIDQLATRLRPTRGWDALILPEERLALVHEVVVRARHRETVFDRWGYDARPSIGVVALFSGASGTGKTLAAEIVAGELGLDLYKIDLSQLVSKYIGETEKNLDRVFEAAGASNVVLFFDEADALLGKRSEVSDAHDRYANIEVAYLLQRLERYDGMVVLATNLRNNIDPAFLRRIHVAVDFPLPEPPERLQIWRRSLPDAVPVADIDFDFLATRFELSGGSIRNTALTAGFLAAEAGTPLTMELAIIALRRELQKLGRLVSPEDFAPYA